jgi:hypothetical protein
VFNGSISVSPTTNFTVNASYQLITTGTVAAGNYTVTLTATMAGAINSPQTVSPTIVITAESSNGTSLASAAGFIFGSSTPGSAGSQITWSMVSAVSPNNPFQIIYNGVTVAASSQVVQVYYIGHRLYQLNSAGLWFVFNGTITTGQPQFTGSSSPIPVITISKSTFPPNSAIGTVVGTLSMTVAGSAVTPVWSISPTTNFSVSGANVLVANGAISNGSQFTETVTANF